jgi:2-keto-3-deoxy-L-rhamnonate aldolase RhmA
MINRFKQSLGQRQTLGMFSTLGSPILVELFAGCGFDWLLLDTEHSPSELPDVIAQLQAMQGTDVSPIVRPAWSDMVLVKRLLDAGAQTLLFPYVQSAAEAAAAVSFTRYPPHGVRGVSGSSRAARYGLDTGYLAGAQAELCVLVQIENAAGLKDLERIADVDGVDGVFIGPSDLAWDGRIGAATIVAWTIGTIGAIFSTQFIVQAISSNKTAADARRSSLLAAALCLPLGIALALIGVAAKFLHPTMNSLYALPVFLQDMNPFLAGLVTTSLVASVFVSVSTVALAIASLIMRDFYVPYFRPAPDKELQATRLISLVIGVLPLVFVFFVPEILRLSFFTRALRLSISIVALIGFFLPMFRSSRGATLGLLAAAVVTTLWYAWGNPYDIDNMYIAAVTPVAVILPERLFGLPKRPVLAGNHPAA